MISTRSRQARLHLAPTSLSGAPSPETSSPKASSPATFSSTTSSRAKPSAATPAPPFRWAGYVAFAWAAAYAFFVRGYQGAGGTLGLAGTFENPAAFRQASLVAGGVILLAGVGALAFVRPWGLRLPRWLPIVPALAGSVYSAAHALTAYVTKTLHLAGAIDLDFSGWARLDEGALIRWDLLFYEPWFLGLGVLVTLAAIHHYRRTGGSRRGRLWLLGVTAGGTLALTAVACSMVIARFA